MLWPLKMFGPKDHTRALGVVVAVTVSSCAHEHLPAPQAPATAPVVFAGQTAITEHANAAHSTEGHATLRQPLGLHQALGTIDSFFQAVMSEDISQLARCTTSRATMSDLRPRARRTAFHAGHIWRSRFRKRTYAHLKAMMLYRTEDLEVFGLEDQHELERQYAKTRSKPMGPHDWIVRVPIRGHSHDGRQLLAREITFWLTPVGDRYVIAHMAEAFPF